MLERDFQSKFSKWLKYKYTGSGCFELKLCKGTSMPFSAVQEHQIMALYQSKHGHIVYKLPDDSYSQKPYDCIRLEQIPAFVVVMFYERGQREFFMIDIDVFMSEMDNSKRKSLTEERAKEIGITCLLET